MKTKTSVFHVHLIVIDSNLLNNGLFKITEIIFESLPEKVERGELIITHLL